jgi:hypothetical protein
MIRVILAPFGFIKAHGSEDEKSYAQNLTEFPQKKLSLQTDQQ